MESAAGRILALLGVAAVFACAAIVFALPLFAALDGALKKWRQMGVCAARCRRHDGRCRHRGSAEEWDGRF